MSIEGNLMDSEMELAVLERDLAREKPRKPILCIDFDGVLHSYTSGWQGADNIPDPPVTGALAFLNDALDRFTVAIFSSRSCQPGGIPAMQAWLRRHAVNALGDGMFADDPMLCWLDMIQWPTTKPSAFISLDDRAVTFNGVWPSLNDLRNFKPWWKSGD